MKNTLEIFNLEFPQYIKELKIGDYSFKRVETYEQAFNNMMHLISSSWGEFAITPKIGSHQITATVTIPNNEKKSILPWERESTQLDDILLLLTLFTDRNVFKKDREDEDNDVIIWDHRIRHYGWQLCCSIKYESMRKNRIDDTLKTEDEIESIELIYDSYDQVDIWFEKSINRILETISSKEWQTKYEWWYFLFLFVAWIQRQIIETSFITCRTIWEHIFAIKNRQRLDNASIEKMSGDQKISFILNEFFLKDINDKSRDNIKKLVKTRNRIIHFWKKSSEIDFKEMGMFIRLTEQLIAIILWLSPSNIFNSFEQLNDFLNTKKSLNKLN